MKHKLPVLAIALALASCSSSDPINVVNDPVALEEVGQDLLLSLAGFQADKVSLSLRELAVEIAATGEAMRLPDSTFETLQGFGPEVVVSPAQVTSYFCNSGGQMTHEVGRLRDGVNLRADYDAYSFDACSHAEAGDASDGGIHQLHGDLIMNAAGYSVDRGSRSSHSSTWTGFSMTTPAGVGYELSGNVDASAYSAANFGSGDTRTVDLPTYRKTSGGRTLESLENVQLFLTRTIPNGSSDSSYQLDAAGITLSPTTMDVPVTINTDPPLSGRRDDSQGILEPFRGQIRMITENAGELILQANPASLISSAPGDLLVDLVAQHPDGESVTRDAVPLIDILSGSIDNACFIIDISAGNCDSVELP